MNKLVGPTVDQHGTAIWCPRRLRQRRQCAPGTRQQRRDGRLVRGLQTSKTSTEQSCRGAVAVLLLCIFAFRSSTPVGRPRTCCTISPLVGLANWELCNFPQIFCYSLMVGRYDISARSKSHILKTKMNRLRGTSIG